VTGYTGTVHFSSSDGAALLPGDYTFTAGDGGVHTFKGGLTFKTAGSQALTVQDKANAALTVTQTGINVSTAAASALVLGGVGSSVAAGVAQDLTVTVKDSLGNTVTGYTGTVHFSSSDGAAVLPA